MNIFCGIGRVTRDLETRFSQTGNAVVKFTLAINRQFKKDGEEKQADFLNCIAFSKTGESLGKFVTKGQQIGITGHIQTGSYENKEGKKVYTTDIIVDSWYFADSKKSGNEPSHSNQAPMDGFTPIDDGDELPF
jgi:single-strand DNA-binding protein